MFLSETFPITQHPHTWTFSVHVLIGHLRYYLSPEPRLCWSSRSGWGGRGVPACPGGHWQLSERNTSVPLRKWFHSPLWRNVHFQQGGAIPNLPEIHARQCSKSSVCFVKNLSLLMPLWKPATVICSRCINRHGHYGSNGSKVTARCQPPVKAG